MDRPTTEEIEIDSFGFGRIGNIGVGEGLHRGEGVVAVMLQCGGIGVSEIVAGCVVVDNVADVGEVESLISGGFEDGEIGVVRDLFVRGVENGAGDRMRGVLREETHGPFVGVTGFEHQARAGGAATVNVDDGADFFGPGMLIDEDASAEQAGFFAVVNEEDDGVARLRERFADARDFEDGGGAGAVVECAGTGGDGIVVRGQENCGPWAQSLPGAPGHFARCRSRLVRRTRNRFAPWAE